MKKSTRVSVVGCLAMVSALVSVSSCSSAPQKQQPQDQRKTSAIELNRNAPTVLNPRTEPQVVILNSDMQPVAPAQVVADVKDFSSRVVEVHLKFADVPLDIPMEQIGSSTNWRAELTPQDLQMLAVSGSTAKYKAHIVAKNANGNTSESKDPVFVSIRAPKAAHYG